MVLSENDVIKIAKLARIDLTESEREHFAREISGILQWVEQLGEVNTDGAPQMTSVCDLKLPRREDKVTDGNQPEAVLANAVNEHGCFVVPKVME